MYGARSSRTCSCKSSNQLRCDQCGKSFQYDPDCVGELGQHSFKNHWVNRIGHFAQGNENSTENTVQWISKAKVNVKCLKQEDLNDQYKTTVESWREGPTDLRCCQCGYTGPPYIRRQKNKVRYIFLPNNNYLMNNFRLFFHNVFLTETIN
ncbi:hypothetical protein WA026_016949 [Henosepilachna vigintioctopunctata]|uniref:Uncharacterized protein n=1 Tax=Henosepilachna vigintioctopunctata TaxID=420089 RepID=A0AAW1UAC8_9CUCU